jgi:DNA processing protein
VSGVPGAEHVAAVALASLEELGPGRLRVLVEHFGSPHAALIAVRERRAESILAASLPVARRAAFAATCATWPARIDPERTRRLLVERGAFVWLDGEPTYPIADPIPGKPVVLLAEGRRPDALDAPRVAIVGTRSATPHGIADARELAATLAEAGVTIVSGLAIGIDGAAHEGALAAGGLTIGVVATGLDVVYPRRHRALYRDVRAHGLVLGETGYGIGPTPARFPVRNRVIAALADIVVVVEATERGGARITAEHALRYDRAVFAVPGSRRNAAAAGTNALIADGAFPLTEWSDVLLALGMTPGARRSPPPRPVPDARGRAIIEALGGEPASPEQLAARTGLGPDDLALAVAALEQGGWVTWSQGLVWPR